MKVQNPHDKFFKETLTKVDLARDFARNYLPAAILQVVDLSTMEPQKDSFIDEELRETFSDLLFRVNIAQKEGFLYFLFEHKSYAGPHTAFQLLKYMVRIWEAKIEKENLRQLPVIVPLVVYHGRKGWEGRTDLAAMVAGYEELPPELKKMVPNYAYLLYDLTRYSDEEIKGEVRLRILLSVFRDIFVKDRQEFRESVLKAGEYLEQLEDKEKGLEYFEIFMRYVFSARADMTMADLKEIVEQMEANYPEGSALTMTLAELLIEEGEARGEARGIAKGEAQGIAKGEARGIAKGEARGIAKGEARALARTVVKLLTKKFEFIPEEMKEKIFQLDTLTLETIVEGVLEYQSLEDVKKYLE